MKAYDIIIIGAGPGGIFAAYELMKTETGPERWLFLRRAITLKKRKCPIDGVKIKSLYQLQDAARSCAVLAEQAHFLMENTISRMISAARCTSISARQQAVDLMKYVDEINHDPRRRGNEDFIPQQERSSRRSVCRTA